MGSAAWKMAKFKKKPSDTDDLYALFGENGFPPTEGWLRERIGQLKLADRRPPKPDPNDLLRPERWLLRTLLQSSVIF